MNKFISNVYCILPFASDATMSTCWRRPGWQGREKISPEQTMHPGSGGAEGGGGERARAMHKAPRYVYRTDNYMGSDGQLMPLCT